MRERVGKVVPRGAVGHPGASISFPSKSEGIRNSVRPASGVGSTRIVRQVLSRNRDPSRGGYHERLISHSITAPLSSAASLPK